MLGGGRARSIIRRIVSVAMDGRVVAGGHVVAEDPDARGLVEVGQVQRPLEPLDVEVVRAR